MAAGENGEAPAEHTERMEKFKGESRHESIKCTKGSELNELVGIHHEGTKHRGLTDDQVPVRFPCLPYVPWATGSIFVWFVYFVVSPSESFAAIRVIRWRLGIARD